MTIEDSQREITDQFADIDDWMDRYAYIIDMGNSLPALPDALKTPDR
ncbi:MAG: SufE family protein, partial [Muribaculaceae bacterium]|nr:SufE family protein [Muribaculaceae bacterium]